MKTDYLIKGGFVIDGKDPLSEPRKIDIAVSNALITDLGELSHINAENTLDVSGLYICPGFIDAHAHSEFVLLADGRAQGKLSQGITTEVNGNCGMSAAPLKDEASEHREPELRELGIKERWNSFSEYFDILEKRKLAINFVTLAGHGNIRASVAGYSDRRLSEAEMSEAASMLSDAMTAGAKGLSTGLVYPPGIFADTQEIIELAKIADRYSGIYTTHMRSEGDELQESVNEVMKIAVESGARVHISHLKTSGEKNWGKIGTVFETINNSIRNGVKVTCDRYPYTASSTDLDVILPAWALEGGRSKIIDRLKNSRARITEEIIVADRKGSLWENTVISSVSLDKNRWMEGRRFADICSSLNREPVDLLFEILVEEDLMTGAIFFVMNEDNLRSILGQPYLMIGTDSSARSFDGITAKGKPHPRGFGSCPRILGRYVREQGLLALPEAVYKMTGLPASTFNIKQRGIIEKRYFADLVIFDLNKINDTADYTAPFKRPEGIYHVFVNGRPVLLEGEFTNEMPGRVLR